MASGANAPATSGLDLKRSGGSTNRLPTSFGEIGATPRSGRVTIGELAQTWYETTAALKPSTRVAYRSLLDAWVLLR
jgi:hypothetical protein